MLFSETVHKASKYKRSIIQTLGELHSIPEIQDKPAHTYEKLLATVRSLFSPDSSAKKNEFYTEIEELLLQLESLYLLVCTADYWELRNRYEYNPNDDTRPIEAFIKKIGSLRNKYPEFYKNSKGENKPIISLFTSILNSLFKLVERQFILAEHEIVTYALQDPTISKLLHNRFHTAEGTVNINMQTVESVAKQHMQNATVDFQDEPAEYLWFVNAAGEIYLQLLTIALQINKLGGWDNMPLHALQRSFLDISTDITYIHSQEFSDILSQLSEKIVAEYIVINFKTILPVVQNS